MPSTLVSPSGQKPLSEAAKQFRYDLLTGLNAPTQAIPSKYFYDQRGSALFDQICELQEYYPTRTEAAIMRRHAPMMAACIGDNARLVEYGSGSSLKHASCWTNSTTLTPICRSTFRKSIFMLLPESWRRSTRNMQSGQLSAISPSHSTCRKHLHQT